MKGIIITTGSKVSVKDFGEPLYQTVGKAVGGYIEAVHPRELEHPLVMLINEEGLLRNLPFNAPASALYGTLPHGQMIVGDVVIMQEGFVDGEPDIVGLDEDCIASLVDRFEFLARLCREVKHA